MSKAWLWPDKAMGKKESRRLREEHNALVNSHEELRAALQDLLEACRVVLSHLPDANVEGSWDFASATLLRAAIAKAEGTVIA